MTKKTEPDDLPVQFDPRPDGTIRWTIEDHTYVLRRIRIGELMALEDLFYDYRAQYGEMLDVETETAAKVAADAETIRASLNTPDDTTDDRPDLIARLGELNKASRRLQAESESTIRKANRYIREMTIAFWTQVFATLCDDPFPAELAPGWIGNQCPVERAFQHWQFCPLLPGGE